MVYDGVLLFCVWLILGICFIALNPAHTVPWWVTQLILWVSSGAYFIMCWRLTGQTLGALAWRLRVVSVVPSATVLSVKQAFLRYILAVASLILLGIGHVWRLFDLDDRTGYDRLSKSRLVLVSKPAATTR